MKGIKANVGKKRHVGNKHALVREYEKKRENGRGHPLNITNTLVFYCISHAKVVLLPMEVDISMTISSKIFNFNDFNDFDKGFDQFR